MIRVVSLLYMVFMFNICFAQTNYPFSIGMSRFRGGKEIDIDAVKSWVSIGGVIKISNNGSFVAYDIRNRPIGRTSLIIQSTSTNWKYEFVDGTMPLFSEDSKQIVFLVNDTLCFLQLDNSARIRRIVGVNAYKEPGTTHARPNYGGGRWMAWKSTKESRELVVYNLFTRKEYKFSEVNDYQFDRNGTCILLQLSNSLKYVDLLTGGIHTIWTAESGRIQRVSSYRFDDEGAQVAFIVSEKINELIINNVWLYKRGYETAILKADNRTSGIPPNLSIDAYVYPFSKNGKYIFIQLTEQSIPKLSDNTPNVNVWHYNDLFLKSLELKRLAPGKVSAVIDIDSNKVVQIEQLNEKIQTTLNDYAVVSNILKDGDRFWLGNNADFWIVSLKDGMRKQLPFNGNKSKCWFSPGGKFILYYSGKGDSGVYCSYEVASGIVRRISAGTSTKFNKKNEYEIDNQYSVPAGICGWLDDGMHVMVYDNYDIWILDLMAESKPLNFTNGFGQQHSIKFNLQQIDMPIEGIKQKSNLLLTAFDMNSKYNGFYYKQIGRIGDPDKLSMGPYTYTISGANLGWGEPFDPISIGQLPLKSRDANRWIVIRQSVSEAPNLFLTDDFVKFRPITDLYPHKDYLWTTAELLHWQQPNGRIGHGILYKPQDFDSTKKYPLLIGYYRQLSHRLYQYPLPQLIRDAHVSSVVSWFTSRGYLVFTPDIYFTNDGVNQDAYNTVHSAAKFLINTNYIDSNRIGISGHSFAGGLTNAIISRTTMFTAAFEGAGRSDEISAGLMISKGGFEGKSRLDVDEANKRSSIWERPDLWVTGSAIFNANKITTPLLIFHCRNDMAMPWEQGLFMFTALRRLQKRVWMLEYEGEGHNLDEEKNAVDLTIRVTQYFDHLLRGAPEPEWMANGITAKDKPTQTGYGYSKSNKEESTGTKK